MMTRDRELMARIRDCVEEYARENGGRTPSTREIAETLGTNNVKVFRYLKEMDEIGMIYYRDGQIMTDQIEKIQADSFQAKNYSDGSAAGPGLYNEGIVDQYYTIPSFLVDGKKGKYFTMKVHGDSMIDVRIYDGDTVICREQEDARIGDIIVAWVEGEGNTIKRLKEDKNHRRYLWAENEKYGNRNFGTSFQIQGVVVKVIIGIE